MKYFTLTLIAICLAFFSLAQMSAENYNLSTSNPDAVSQGLDATNVTLESGDETSDFYKRRRKKKKSSPLGFGFLLGGGISDVSAEVNDEMVNGKFGFAFGAFAFFKFNESMAIKSGLHYHNKGFGVKDGYGLDGIVDHYNYLNVPILFTYFFDIKYATYVNAGPVFSILLSAKEDGEDIKEGMNTSDFGLFVGGGIIIPVVESRNSPAISLVLDANYQLGLADINDSGDNKMTNNAALFSIGVQVGGI